MIFAWNFRIDDRPATNAHTFPLWLCCMQSGGSVVVVDDDRVNASLRASVLAQSYSNDHHRRCQTTTTRHYVNAHLLDARRRPAPDIAAESYRVYTQPDVPVAPGGSSSVDQQLLFSSTERGAPVSYTRPDVHQPPVDQEVTSMRCETCQRPAMFVCSACKKAPYCSVDCQVSLRDFCRSS